MCGSKRSKRSLFARLGCELVGVRVSLRPFDTTNSLAQTQATGWHVSRLPCPSYLYSRTAPEKAVSYRRVSQPHAPTYRPPVYRMKTQRALALLVEQGMSESEAAALTGGQSAPQQEDHAADRSDGS